MGRSLFYGTDNSVMLTSGQKIALHELAKKYRREYKWDCISAWFPYIYKYDSSESGDDEFDAEEAAQELIELWESKKYRDKDSDDDEEDDEFGINGVSEEEIDFSEQETILAGCTIAGGNEFDAHNVIKFVRDASIILPEHVFYLDDDGFALYCPVLIKNGLAKPDHARINYQLEIMINNFLAQKNGLYDPAKRIRFYEKLKDINEWIEIDKFTRPVIVTEKPEKTPEKNVDDFDDLDDETLERLKNNIAIEEFLEQTKYYDDIDSYPENI
jgi:hypothetical protein